MLRTALLGAVFVATVGSTAYASQRSLEPKTPQAAPEQQPAPEAEATPPKRNLAGVYLCEGANPDGSPYRGLVEIVAVDSTYLVRWFMSDGAEVLGVGIRNKDVLSVSYFGGTPAVVVYSIDGDRLNGEWTMGGAEGKLYSETLTRMPDEKPKKRKTRPTAGSLSV